MQVNVSIKRNHANKKTQETNQSVIKNNSITLHFIISQCL